MHGPESVGKSTLARQLAAHFGTIHAPEYGRIWCAQFGMDLCDADLVAIGRAVVVDPEWLSKVRSEQEASILAGLPQDEREIAEPLSIPPRMVDYLLSRPGWIPRL